MWRVLKFLKVDSTKLLPFKKRNNVKTIQEEKFNKNGPLQSKILKDQGSSSIEVKVW